MCGASGSSPIAFSAKYAFTLADRLNAPSWNSGQPPCAPWIDAQIDADLRFQRRIDAVEEMLQQHVFGRDGGVGLQLEHPVPVRVLLPRQRRRRRASIASCSSVVRRGLGRQQGLARHARVLRRPSSTSAAVRPDLMAPSIVPGNPVAVQSPASTRLASAVRGPGRSRSCAAVAAKVARRSFTTRHGGIGVRQLQRGLHIRPDRARRSSRRPGPPSGWPR